MTLREKRIESGMSVKTLSEKVGVSEAFIRYVEYGQKNPSIKTALKIATALDCTLDDLFTEKTKIN